MNEWVRERIKVKSKRDIVMNVAEWNRAKSGIGNRERTKRWKAARWKLKINVKG